MARRFEAMVAARDERFGIRTEEERASRADISPRRVAEGADAWQTGKVLQITDPTGHAHPARSP